MSKLSIRRLNSPSDDSNAVNLETIVLGDKTLKKIWILWGSKIHLRCKLSTHEHDHSYGKSSYRMVGYPSRIIAQTSGKFKIRDKSAEVKFQN